MNLKKIAELLTLQASDKTIESLILLEISTDEKAIIYMMEILNGERERNQKLITEMNLLLSKAETAIETPKLNKDNFIQKEVAEFYKKHKGVVGHCFKNYNK